MVSYQKWTEIVFRVAPDHADAPDVISWAAARWRERKDDLQNATVREAEQWARSRL